MAERNLPVAQQAALEILHNAQAATRAELDVLRRTRPQREVGALKVPAHLAAAAAIPITLAGPVSNDPRVCSGCGNGIDAFALSRGEKVCSRCLNNPNTDAGVEARATIPAGA